MSDYTVKENDNDYTKTIFYKDEEVFFWDDEWSADCPEDMIWGRLIKQVFEAGIELGKKMAKE